MSNYSARLFVLAPFVAVVLMLGGCSKSAESKLLGTWATNSGGAVIEYTFGEPDRFSTTAGAGTNKPGTTVNGTWKMKDGVLVISLPEKPDTSFKVVSVEDSALTLQRSGESANLIFQRKN